MKSPKRLFFVLHASRHLSCYPTRLPLPPLHMHTVLRTGATQCYMRHLQWQRLRRLRRTDILRYRPWLLQRPDCYDAGAGIQQNGTLCGCGSGWRLK